MCSVMCITSVYSTCTCMEYMNYMAGVGILIIMNRILYVCMFCAHVQIAIIIKVQK